MLGTGYPAWLAELDDGDIPAILAAARALPLATRKARDRDKALHYFGTNEPLMRHAQYRALGLFVGSGVAEADCKSGQRLKLSGMRWTEHGATGILTLRGQESSGRWIRHGRSPATRTAPDAHLPKTRTQTSQAIRPYPRVTYIRVPTPPVAYRACLSDSRGISCRYRLDRHWAIRWRRTRRSGQGSPASGSLCGP
jgi:hypothetical protein